MSAAYKIANAEIRAARKWLKRRKLDEHISPRQFAHAAKLMNKGFKETLQVIAQQAGHGVT